MASSRSPLTSQHMHPFASSRKFSFVDTIRLPSIPMSPNSFTITPIFSPCSSVSTWFTKVVFPAPSAPVMIVTGIFVILSCSTHNLFKLCSL